MIPELASRNTARPRGPRPFGLAAVFMILAMSGCALTPDPPFELDSTSILPSSTHDTFDTGIVPSPGRSELLRSIERELVEQMKAHGYTAADSDADLQIQVRMEGFAEVEQLNEPRTGRIELRMDADEHLLRVGRTPTLNQIALDHMTQDEITEIVSLFLEGMPER